MMINTKKCLKKRDEKKKSLPLTVFFRTLAFYARFPYIGAYNAALVEQQRPGARFVQTARKWKKEYGRKIKLNSRPVMILLPFYPVEFLFDISDTIPIDENTNVDDNAVIEDIIKSNSTSCSHDIGYYMNYLQVNLPKFGISYNNDYIVGSERRAEIVGNTSDDIYVRVYKEARVKYHSYYTISVDMKAKGPDELALLFHELGHFYNLFMVEKPGLYERSEGVRSRNSIISCM